MYIQGQDLVEEFSYSSYKNSTSYYHFCTESKKVPSFVTAFHRGRIDNSPGFLHRGINKSFDAFVSEEEFVTMLHTYAIVLAGGYSPLVIRLRQ